MSISAIASTLTQPVTTTQASQNAAKPDGDGDKGVEPASKPSTTATSSSSPLATLAQGKPLYG